MNEIRRERERIDKLKAALRALKETEFYETLKKKVLEWDNTKTGKEDSTK